MSGVNKKQCNMNTHTQNINVVNKYTTLSAQKKIENNLTNQSSLTTEINCVFICNRTIYIKYTTSTIT